MLGKQHMIFGFTSGLTAGCYLCEVGSLPFGYVFGFAALSAVGSLLPDIDTPESLLGRKIKPISKPLNNTIGHRTYTHSVALWTILTIVAYLKLTPIWWSLFIGAIGHLLLDALTLNGVPLFIIGTKKDSKLRHIHLMPKFLRCRTGSFWSYTLTFLLSVTVALPAFL